MIISQLLLFLFVGYWLNNQYSEQKSILTKDLQRGFLESEQQTMDSIMAKYIINPILEEAEAYTVEANLDLPIGTTTNLKINKEFKELDVSDNKAKINILCTDTVHIINKPQKDTNNQKLLYQHGVKMVMSKIIGNLTTISGYFTSDGKNSTSAMPLASKVDTGLLKKKFTDFLNKNNYNFLVNWTSKQEQTSSQKKHSVIYLNCNFFDDSIRSEISHYQFFLLKKISPQILFALLLLLLTSAAFRMAYISMKNQKRLITIKNDFISNISHELKTPVSTVKVALEALLDFDMKKNPKVVNEYLEMSLSEMNRLDLLITKVLNASALEDGKQFVVPEKTNLNLLIDEVLHSLQLRFNQLQAEVKFESEENECMAMLDKLHIQGVLINLIDNSLKYCNGKPCINIYLSENEKEIKLTISDTGIGIPEEYLDKVFDKFFRIPTGNTHNVKGYGLGLNYAVLVMKHHHGKIEVKNLKEGGCAFTLIFPKLMQ